MGEAVRVLKSGVHHSDCPKRNLHTEEGCPLMCARDQINSQTVIVIQRYTI